ncbi:hypothetical protein PR003_g18944 [Phytophthora rubi]|uniref:Uncharacterized protein n=1 Tax=Phytophthora rubi TaxID=129364 RepID=A0A6A4E9N4_9STRA|nr:hypothetical protein PR003_g18944 [Phytophthora rubi]
MLDNNFPGRRYNDRELAEYMKALRNSAPITLPKLHSKGNYKAWKSEWYPARKTKAFSVLALSLSVDLRSTFKIDELRDDMEAASVLWQAITKYFEAGYGINPDYLLRDLLMRVLQPNERVDS